MKLSNVKIIRWLNLLSTVVLGFYIFFIIIQIFSSNAPSMSNSVRGYSVKNIKVVPSESSDTSTTQHSLNNWFQKKVVVQEVNTASVDLRFKSYEELFSLPAVLFQLFQFTYWLLIGALIVFIKKLFYSFSEDQVFTKLNSLLLFWSSILLILLPVFRYKTQGFFINCIVYLNQNDSGYRFENGENLITAETLIGLVLLAFSFVFRAAVDMKKENESFI